MKKFKQLIIRRSHEELVSLLNNLKSCEGIFAYKRNKSLEYARNIFHTEETVACFATERNTLAKASVWVVVTNDELKVTNITPNESGSLGIVAYNIVLDSFRDFLINCLDESWSNSILITEEEVAMSEILTHGTFEALQRWERTCNHVSPIMNEQDRQLWFEFICLLHRDETDLNMEDFSQWLSEDCRWPNELNDIIYELALRLEYSLDLLRHCDGND